MWVEASRVRHYELQWRRYVDGGDGGGGDGDGGGSDGRGAAGHGEGGCGEGSREDGGGWLSTPACSRVVERRVLLRQLAEGQAYLVRVRLVTAGGHRSGWSAAVAPALTAPERPRVFPSGDGVVRISHMNGYMQSTCIGVSQCVSTAWCVSLTCLTISLVACLVACLVAFRGLAAAGARATGLAMHQPPPSLHSRPRHRSISLSYYYMLYTLYLMLL